MTIDELKKNIDEGREWLKAHGFKTFDSIEKYFEPVLWKNDSCFVEIWEYNRTLEAYCANRSLKGEWAWLCNVWLDCNSSLSHTETFGRTPEEALRKSLEEWDKEMDRRRRARFGAILEKTANG